MKSETTRLLEDRVAVRPDAPETETEGGITIPNPAGKGRGTVVACGPGRRVLPRNEIQYMAVKPGDVVLYGRFTGGEVTVSGEPLLLMRECDVVAVVEEAPVADAADEPYEGALDVAGHTPPCDCGREPPHPPTNCPHAHKRKRTEDAASGNGEATERSGGNSAICGCGCGVGPHTKFYHENRGEAVPFIDGEKPEEKSLFDDFREIDRVLDEEKPGKTTYDARCGADCDCTPVDGSDVGRGCVRDGEIGDIRDKAAKAGFCTRCCSFGCDCPKHVADETVNAGERLARRLAEVDEKTDESKDGPTVDDLNDLNDSNEGTS